MSARNETHAEVSADRRRVLKTGAWAVPVIAFGIATPAHAASRPCPQLNNAALWSAPVVAGPLRAGSQAQFNNQYGGTYLTVANNATSFLSVQDRVTGGAGTTTVTISAPFTPVAGTAYTFSFRARASNVQSTVQTLAVTINNVQQWNAATKANFGPTRILGAEAAYSFTWTAPSSTTATIRFVFSLPLATGDNDDIRINLPVVTAATCR
ncbi:hypothetical protein C5E06_10035 [Pseudoclavibacter sp. RFBI5]|uniref:hypothetical protein n=1 Tax=Pseudoclavibacter sp. RFBI5 TaxID=2080578 RepID=UPI000CE729C2|nr:hypothetical protein [Pseudoclavibacter sp. RFBI5]PPG02780.1 hypothetical protein C5E06_10035 [Pseudoclavibacter sp. RFBI5]